jgi:hypothetical protein
VCSSIASQPVSAEAAICSGSGVMKALTRMYERYLIGHDLLGDLHDRLGHRHLEVELGRDALLERPDIAVVDVPAILAQVHGDPVRPGQLAFGRRPHRVRLIRPPRVADGRHMIDIDVENSHIRDLLFMIYHLRFVSGNSKSSLVHRQW